MASIAAPTNSVSLPSESTTNSFSTSHIPTTVNLGSPEHQQAIIQRVAQVVAYMNEKQSSVDLSSFSFSERNDVNPSDSYNVRVRGGTANEPVIKDILRAYGLEVDDVDRNTDMYRKIDFFVKGPFGRLSVQFKHRNIKKNSTRNDLGVEYIRIKKSYGRSPNYRGQNRRAGLYCRLGRDRVSIADVYLCVDPVKCVLHWVPTVLIEDASRDLHTPYEVIVSENLRVFINSRGERSWKPYFSIRGLKKDTNEIINSGPRSLCLKHDEIGEIRYFQPHVKSEGVFKAIFYMNERFMKDWEHDMNM